MRSLACHGCAPRLTLIGLHREPTTFGHFSNVDVHIRRQIWWSIVSIDAQVAFASGLPPILDCRLYNVLPVSEISAAAIREDFESHGNANKSVLGIFIGGRFAFYKRGNEILHLLHSSLLSEKDLDRILEITRAIKEDMDSRTEQIHLIEKMTTTSEPCDGTDIGAVREDVVRSVGSKAIFCHVRSHAETGLIACVAEEAAWVSISIHVPVTGSSTDSCQQRHCLLPGIRSSLPSTSRTSRFSTMALVLAWPASTSPQHHGLDHRLGRPSQRPRSCRDKETCRPCHLQMHWLR